MPSRPETSSESGRAAGRALRMVIATAGGNPALARTLDSLAQCRLPQTYVGALILENGAPMGVSELLDRFPDRLRLTYVHVARANKSHALNIALDMIGDELIFFSDDDVRFSAELLHAYADAAREIDGGEYYGGPLGVDWEAEPPPVWLRRYLPKTAVGWRLEHTSKTRLKVPLFLGPNWAAFASDLRRIGGFDLRLGPGGGTGSTGQESDAQARLADAGVTGHYVPDAMAWHTVRSECGSPEWALRRAHRHGLEWGIRRATRRPIASLPPVVRFRRFWSAVRSYRASRSSDLSVRFRRAFHDAKWKGRFEGLELGRSWRLHGRD